MAQVPSIYKYKYIGLPLAMQMKLNKIHESWYRSYTHIAVSHAKYS